MRVSLFFIPCVVLAFSGSVAVGQQRDSGGGGSSTTIGGPTTVFVPSSNSGSSFNSSSTGQTSGMTSAGSTGGTGTPGSTTVGTTVISRPGFLDAATKRGKGFMTPSNTTSLSTSTGRGTTGLTGVSTRLGGLGGLGGLGSQFGNTNRNSTNSTTTQLRIPMQVAPNPAVAGRVRNVVSTQFTERVTKLPGLQTSGVTMTAAEGRKAVLRGKVASTEQADLLGRLALLEPGISNVQNELTIDPELASLETLPSGQ
jgi:hypothetical protein